MSRCIRDHDTGQAAGSAGQAIVIPTITLGTLLNWIPAAVVVDLVKVDAQGADLMILRTMGPAKKRVRNLQIEVQDLQPSDRLRMYENGANRKESSAEITGWGFTEKVCKMQNCAVGEMNCLFTGELRPTTTNY